MFPYLRGAAWQDGAIISSSFHVTCVVDTSHGFVLLVILLELVVEKVGFDSPDEPDRPQKPQAQRAAVQRLSLDPRPHNPTPGAAWLGLESADFR